MPPECMCKRPVVAYVYFIPLLGSLLKTGQVVCGECALASQKECLRSISGLLAWLWCIQADHFKHGEQVASEVFGVDCGICLETAAEKYDDAQSRIDRVHTPCGMSCHPGGIGSWR